MVDFEFAVLDKTSDESSFDALAITIITWSRIFEMLARLSGAVHTLRY